MRRAKASAAVALLLFSSAARLLAASAEEMGVALQAIITGVYSTIAAHVSTPQISLPGVEVVNTDTEAGYSVVTYLRADLADMRSALTSPDDDSVSLLGRLLGLAADRVVPLRSSAVLALESLGVEEGDIILDGTLVVSGRGLDILDDFLTVVVNHDFSPIDMSVRVSMLVSGSDFPDPLAFEGTMSAKGRRGGVTLTTENMTCNNLPIIVAPMEFSVG